MKRVFLEKLRRLLEHPIWNTRITGFADRVMAELVCNLVLVTFGFGLISLLFPPAENARLLEGYTLLIAMCFCLISCLGVFIVWLLASSSPSFWSLLFSVIVRALLLFPCAWLSFLVPADCQVGFLPLSAISFTVLYSIGLGLFESIVEGNDTD